MKRLVTRKRVKKITSIKGMRGEIRLLRLRLGKMNKAMKAVHLTLNTLSLYRDGLVEECNKLRSAYINLQLA